MSIGEPDIEPSVPPAPIPRAGRPRNGELTAASIATSAMVAALMGASYPYMVLKLGFGPSVSVVAAFFGFLILGGISLVFKTPYDRWQNNIVQTAGTAAAQTAFMCVLLGAFDILRADPSSGFHLELTTFTTFLWLTTASILGVLMAVPLRRHFIVDEKLPFVDGVAVAETLAVLDPPRGIGADPELLAAARRAGAAMVIGLLVAGGLMLAREEGQLGKLLHFHALPDGLAETWFAGLTVGGIAMGQMGVGVSWGLLSIGSGMLVGLRINASMMLGGVLAWIILPGILVDHHWVDLADKAHPLSPHNRVLMWVMWPATGMLVAGGFTALFMRWRLLIDTFRSLRRAKVGGDDFPLPLVIGGVVAMSIALCVVQYTLLGMPVWMTAIAILLSIPLMLVGLRVLGETNWGPISALSNMMQGLFAFIAPGHMVANMVASGTTGTVATSSEAIMQDYKTGDLIGSTPRAMTIAQLCAVPIGAAAVALIYPLLVRSYGIVGENAQLTSPISRKWAGFAQVLHDGPGALPSSAMWALAIFSVIGVVLTVLESNKHIKQWVPSPTGIGIGILVPFAVVAAMFIGGTVGWIWERVSKRTFDAYMIPLASGFIAGEALIATIMSIVLAIAT